MSEGISISVIRQDKQVSLGQPHGAAEVQFQFSALKHITRIRDTEGYLSGDHQRSVDITIKSQETISFSQMKELLHS